MDVELWLTTDAGRRVALLDNALAWRASRVVNGIGALTLELPASFDDTLLERDRLVQAWIAPSGSRVTLWRVYFIRQLRFETGGRVESIIVRGLDQNALLASRIVAYAAGSSQADKSGPADNLMKAFVDENLVSATDADRNWSQISVAPNVGLGPSVDIAAARKPLNRVLQELADAARQNGTEVFFDLEVTEVTSSSIAFAFRTYVHQPGSDVTDSVIFDQERGNLADPWLEYDWSDERTVIYGLGDGRGSDREVVEVEDAGRVAQSVWGRREDVADARGRDATTSAQAALAAAEPRIRAGGRALDVAGTRFGRDWNIGDRVRMRYRAREFDCIVRAVQLSGGKEKRTAVEARLVYEG